MRSRATAGRGGRSWPPMAPSAWPPREVKSSAQTTAVRPSILPQPPTWLAGVKSGDPAVVVVAGEAGEAADLAEAAGVEQQVDPLAAGQLAAAALAHHARVLRVGREAAWAIACSACTSASIGAQVSSP